jgi:DNA-directed RNA polymerase specialized sigma24 family protein
MDRDESPDRKRQESNFASLDASVIDLHDLIIKGDQEALQELLDRLGGLLRRQLRRAFSHAPDDLIIDAANDALIEYALRPAMFDVSRNVPLERFLYRAAWRNLADSTKAAAKRREREARYVQLSPLLVDPAAERDPDSNCDDNVKLRILEIAAGPREQSDLLLWLNGERRTGPIAAVLGMNHLDAPGQRQEVKRFKDRLVKRIRRFPHGTTHC